MPIFNVKDAPFDAVGDGVVDDTGPLRAALSAAAASVHGPQDPAVIVFPPGVYNVSREVLLPGGAHVRASIELVGARDVEMRSYGPGTATLVKRGSAYAGDWYALRLSRCERIRVHGLTFDGKNETNPDPAEQAHLIQIDGGCQDVIVRECEFRTCIGDGIRLLGEGTKRNRDVVIEYCSFRDCGRSGVSFQRFNTNVRIRQCEFAGGTDQQIDFEPTGVAFVAGPTSTASVIVGAQVAGPNGGLVVFDLRTLGLAVGDVMRVQEANQRVAITQVTAAANALHLTVSPALPSSIAGMTILVYSNTAHEITGNVLRDSANAQTSIMTLSGAHRCRISNNRLAGPLQGGHVSDTVIELNQIKTDPAYMGVAVNLIGGSDGVVLRGNLVHCESNLQASGPALQIIHHNGRRSTNAVIEGNVIDTSSANAINVESVKRIRITGNRILKTPSASSPRDSAINVRSHAVPGLEIEAITVKGNHIVSGKDPWHIGIQLKARQTVLAAAIVADNVHSNSEIPILSEAN